MHWLMILGLLTATTDIRDQNASGSQLNRLAENAIRQQLGNSVRNVRVDLKRGPNRVGDFDYFNINLDGFDANRFEALQNRSPNTNRRDDYYPNRLGQSRNFDIGDIFNGDFGGIFNGNIGDVIGGVLTGGVGRVGRMQINAGNFSYDNVRYDGLSAGLGEIRFDWNQALRGDFDVKSIQPGNLGVRLRSDQATKLIAPRLPSVRDVRLRFDNGLANLSGRSDFVGVGIPFEAAGRLSVRTNQVRADDMRLKIAKLRLPEFVMNEITKGVNPLYDFDPNQKWPIAVNLNTADSNNDMLAMRGGLQWLGFNRNERNDRRDNRRNDNRRNGDYYGDDYYNDDYNDDYRNR